MKKDFKKNVLHIAIIFEVTTMPSYFPPLCELFDGIDCDCVLNNMHDFRINLHICTLIENFHRFIFLVSASHTLSTSD